MDSADTTAGGLPPLVQVYRNIHRSRAAGRPVYSVRDAATGRVVAHTDRIVLADATFKVSEAGRQRVIAEGKKNVHAFTEGRPVDSAGVPEGVAVTYNPYKYTSFVAVPGEVPVRSAALVELAAGVTASGVSPEVRP